MAKWLYTENGQIKFENRNIKGEVLKCLKKFGRVSVTPGGLTQIFLSRRQAKKAIEDLKKVIRQIQHTKGVTVLESNRSTIINYRNKL